MASVSITANWLDQSSCPTKEEMSNFLSGHAFNATAGYWGGVSQSWSPSTGGGATGVGLVTPQLGVSYNYSFQGD